MSQFLVSAYNLKDKTFEVTGSDAFKLNRVLRKKPGDAVRLFDGKGRTLWGEISTLSDMSVRGRLMEAPPSFTPSYEHLGRGVLLYQSIPKGQRWDWVLEKGCELGVAAFYPMRSANSVVTIEKKDVPSKLERWKRIVATAAKQCNTPRIPEVAAPLSFEEAMVQCSKLKDVLKIFCWEAESATPLWRLFGSLQVYPKLAVLFIGPEGGWSQAEVETARRNGFLMAGLGPLVLRSDTAPLVAV